MKALRHFLAALSFVVLGSTVQAAGFNTPQSGASYTAQGQGELPSLTTLVWLFRTHQRW